MLEPFGEDIWIAAGPDVVSVGFRYPTRMAVIRLADGGLFVWSPVTLTLALRAETDALGPVRCIVAPNSLHHLALPQWRAAYPDATLYAAPGLRARRKDIVFDADLGDGAPPAWSGQLDQVVVRGNAITTEIVFFHRASGTALFTDLLQNFPERHFRGMQAIVARLDGMIGAEARVPRKFRLAFTDRKRAREGVDRILAWPTRQVLMAHGAPVRAGGQAYLRRAFEWLGPSAR